VLTLAALLLAVPAAPAPAPERPILDAFRTACERTGDLDAMNADAAASGWKAIAEDADPRIAKITRLGRDAVEKDGKISGVTYRRTISGREIFLITSRYEDKSGFWGVGCRLYDFDASAPIATATLESWMGKAPTGVDAPAPGLHRRLWEPGWRNGMTFEASYVPAGHEIGTRFGVQGNVLISQAIGGF
jgi:hypothetical protein